MIMLQASKQARRDSGIELLKIFAILLIITSHVVQTLGSTPSFFPAHDFVVKIEEASANPQMLIVSMLRYSGAFGNALFFICSAWFLIDRKRNEKPKALQMIADNWTVSILILVVFLVARGRLNGSLVLRSLFPFYFSNNWYINCYVVFLLIYPLLNTLIENLDQKTFLRAAVLMIVWVFALPFTGHMFKHLFGGGPESFCAELGNWCAIYIIIAYWKRYRKSSMNNNRLNLLLVLIGFVGTYGVILLANNLGRRFSVLKETLIIWNSNNRHPFILLMAIGLFNLARGIKLKNAAINYISGLSLYIYIVHENILVRYLIRPAMWQFVYEKYGYGHILAFVFVQVAIVFLCSLAFSMFYFHSLHRLVIRTCHNLYPKIAEIYCRLENRYLFGKNN